MGIDAMRPHDENSSTLEISLTEALVLIGYMGWRKLTAIEKADLSNDSKLMMAYNNNGVTLDNLQVTRHLDRAATPILLGKKADFSISADEISLYPSDKNHPLEGYDHAATLQVLATAAREDSYGWGEYFLDNEKTQALPARWGKKLDAVYQADKVVVLPEKPALALFRHWDWSKRDRQAYHDGIHYTYCAEAYANQIHTQIHEKPVAELVPWANEKGMPNMYGQNVFKNLMLYPK